MVLLVCPQSGGGGGGGGEALCAITWICLGMQVAGHNPTGR